MKQKFLFREPHVIHTDISHVNHIWFACGNVQSFKCRPHAVFAYNYMYSYVYAGVLFKENDVVLP